MASERNIGELLLDAAREALLAVGWRRTTLTDIAGRAGVSRMTVYRHYPDMPALLGDLMTREWTGLIERVGAEAARADDPVDRVARTLADAVTATRHNELFRRIVDVDPDLLLPYLVDRRGRTQQAVLDLLVSQIRDAQEAGAARDGDPELLARALMLTAQGFLISIHTMTDETVTESHLGDELADLISRYLRR